jgi:hypothetical protein
LGEGSFLRLSVTASPGLSKTLDRRAIRRRFEERFSVERMARDYVTLYGEILERGTVDAVLNRSNGSRDGERCLT